MSLVISMVSGKIPIAIQLVQFVKCKGQLYITAITDLEQSTLQQATPEAPHELKWTLCPCITSLSPGKMTPCGILTCPLCTTVAKKVKCETLFKILEL